MATLSGDEGDVAFILRSFAQGSAIPIPGVVGPYHLGRLEVFGSVGSIPGGGAPRVQQAPRELAHVNGHLTSHYRSLVIDTEAT